jgi:hypothetical protein
MKLKVGFIEVTLPYHHIAIGIVIGNVLTIAVREQAESYRMACPHMVNF